MRSVRRCVGVVIATCALLADQLALSPAGTAASDHLPVAEYLACGYDGSSPTPPDTCQSLPDAITAALSTDSLSAGAATIVLMPGDYCPITVSDQSHDGGTVRRALTFEGGGETASETTIRWSSTFCSDEPSALITVPSYDAGSNGLELNDLAIDGTGGPATGLDIANASVRLRDVLVENNTQSGIHYAPTATGWNITVANSALLNNGYGFDCSCGRSAITGTTVAGNTVGVAVSGQFSLTSDTIAHNATGADIQPGSTIGTADTIIGGNVIDCSGSVESATGGSNLLGVDCDPQQSDQDIMLTDTIGDVSDTDPTPSITPPDQATGNGNPDWCGDQAMHGDQLEHLQPVAAACDIGSVDSQATTATPSGALDYQGSTDQAALGDVPQGQTSSGIVRVSNAGAGLLTITGASVDNPALSVRSDGCTYTAVLGGAYCWLNVAATPTTPGAISGTLTVTTNGGTVTIPVAANGIDPLAPPTELAADAGYQHATVSWTASSSAAVQATPDLNVGYELDESTDDGATWHDVSDHFTQTSEQVPLDDGLSYRFRVCTEDAYTSSAAPGPCTDASPAVMSRPDPSALSNAVTSSVDYGKPAHFATTLTDATTQNHLVAKPVTLWIRPFGAASFTPVTQLSTGQNGTASIALTPTRLADYEWRFAGGGANAPTISAISTVTVAQTVTAALQHATVQHAKNAEVYGTVAPSAAGQKVLLQCRRSGMWTTLATGRTKLQTLPDHRHLVGFVVRHTFAHAGTYALRIERPATSALVAGLSKTISLKVT